MAVNTITFGGVNSADYGIYISGEGVFNAPVRDAEMISIPGRDGSFLLDNGRYENIEVTYPAFNTETDKATFIAQVDAFRNAIASQKGYQRLEDTFHTDEYRMASFIGGLEINPVLYNDHTSQFEIVFNCKPQRFLKSGESAVSKANNSTITNPTLFDAHPLLQFTASGNGTITINGQDISLLNAPYGTIAIPYRILRSNARDTIIPEESLLNTGDTFTVIGAKVTFTLQSNSPITVSVPSGQDLQFYPPESGSDGNKYYLTFRDTIQASSFTKGTTKTVTKTASLTLTTGGTTYNKTVTLEMGLNSSTQLTVDWRFNAGGVTIEKEDRQYTDLVVTGDSTVYSLTGDLYVDLDIGEAYRVQNGVYSSINNYVNIGGELPTLPPGNSTITYSNTVSNFKITPRWWKI